MKHLLSVLAFSLSLQAATVVSSITCSGQTATVNSTAHGLIASQGFVISGTAPTFMSTASTVTANALTFVLPTGTPCSGFTSGYTTIQAARQIIDLATMANIPQGTITFSYLQWYTTTFPTPVPGFTSAWFGASAAENAALQAGTTVELSGQVTLPASASAATVESTVITQYNAMQTGFANFLFAGGFCYYGPVVGWVSCATGAQ